jgi:hypothetical protein
MRPGAGCGSHLNRCERPTRRQIGPKKDCARSADRRKDHIGRCSACGDAARAAGATFSRGDAGSTPAARESQGSLGRRPRSRCKARTPRTSLVGQEVAQCPGRILGRTHNRAGPDGSGHSHTAESAAAHIRSRSAEQGATGARRIALPSSDACIRRQWVMATSAPCIPFAKRGLGLCRHTVENRK